MIKKTYIQPDLRLIKYSLNDVLVSSPIKIDDPEIGTEVFDPGEDGDL